MIKKKGTLPVRLDGEVYTAPYSRKSCVWFNWIHHTQRLRPESGYTSGSGTDENNITVKSAAGDLTGYPVGIMLYLAPSFDGKSMVAGKEKYIWEFCLEPDREYYAFTEKFTYHLPPLFFFPRRKTALLLALSDTPLEKGRPLNPLIPICQGRTG